MLSFMDGSSLDHTIEKNHHIEKSFKQSAEFVQNFLENNMRLPSQSEFDEWTTTQKQNDSFVEGMQLISSNYSDEAIEKFGTPKAGAYLLAIWRGEWYEYYASWTDTNSLSFNKKDYYMLGYWWADALLILGIGVTLLLLCWLIELRLTKQINMDR